MSKISSIIPYFSSPVQIILHNSKNGRFPTLTKDCLRIPKEAQKNKTTIHIGHVVGHYFLIRNTKYLNTLTAEDFERFDGKDDYLISKLVTTNSVRIHCLVKVGGKMLYEDRTDIAITEKRIKSYQAQDKKAKRGVVPLSVDEVRTILSHQFCHLSGKKLSWSKWFLDKADNELPHSLVV